MIALGLDGWRELAGDDPVDTLLREAVAAEVTEYRRREREQLAAAIVNALAKALR